MTDPARLTARFAAGDKLAAAWLSLGSVAVAEIAAASGVDLLVIDRQHGLWERLALEAAVGLAGRSVPVLVRVAENGTTAISEALDSGADGVVVPLVETAGEAAAAVAAARFPPAGRRSGGGVRPLAMGFDRYLERAGGLFVAVMIETALGVDNAEAIAAVPGLDMVLIGTGDLGLSYAGSADPQASREAGVRRVLAACLKAGVLPAIFTTDPQAARQRQAEGFRLTVAANDIDVVRGGFAAAAGQIRADG